MSLTIPIEDLPRLKVIAHLSPDGLPVLSMTMGSSSSMPATTTSSGVYINFERTNENGFWSLSMKTFVDPQTQAQGVNEDGSSRASTSGTNPMRESTDLDVTGPEVAGPSTSTVNTTGGTNTAQSQTNTSNVEAADFSWLPASAPDNEISMFSSQWNQGVSVPPLSLMEDTETALQDSRPFPDLPHPATTPQSIINSGSSASSTLPTVDNDLVASTNPPEPQPPDETGPVASSSSTGCFPATPSSSGQTRRTKRTFPCTMGCDERFSRQHDRFRHEVFKHGKQIHIDVMVVRDGRLRYRVVLSTSSGSELLSPVA
ncbi:hypothetical protein PQX77_003966 [Marasmius sp. AFHP31]|nr:hypothetical protein PQX77_003966 [Marasmius sp. AFHP31]